MSSLLALAVAIVVYYIFGRAFEMHQSQRQFNFVPDVLSHLYLHKVW
jgi:hypothetical protein